MKIPIILITGFLGSGKTTLLRHLLQSSNQKIAVLMNEFGDIGIDTQTIQNKNIAVKELLEGCVCCSLLGEFKAGIAELIRLYHPELIIVETTGIAEADNLILDINENIPNVRLDCTLNVVDADIMQRFPELGFNIKTQIQTANILVLNKKDLVSTAQLKEIEQKLKILNPSALIVQTTFSKINSHLLFSSPSNKSKPKSQFSPHHQRNFENYTLTIKPLNKGKFSHLLQNLHPSFSRMKGYLTFSKSSYWFNYVFGRVSFEKVPSSQIPSALQNKLVCIGENIKKEKHTFIKKLRTCYLNEVQN